MGNLELQVRNQARRVHAMLASSLWGEEYIHKS